MAEDKIRDPEQGRHGRRRRRQVHAHPRAAFEQHDRRRPLVYLGEPAGFVFEVENGTKLYFAGDTDVFGDMQLIGRLYEPDVAILPIGGHFTMGPQEAAVALELLGVTRCVPCHYGTFPLLAGTPDELRELAPSGVEIVAIEPGRDDRGLRQRWFGATREQVPQLAVEGEIEFPAEPLVLDELDDAQLREAHDEGTPVVVRADTRGEGAGRARPAGSSLRPRARRRSCSRSTSSRPTYG